MGGRRLVARVSEGIVGSSHVDGCEGEAACSSGAVAALLLALGGKRHAAQSDASSVDASAAVGRSSSFALPNSTRRALSSSLVGIASAQALARGMAAGLRRLTIGAPAAGLIIGSTVPASSLPSRSPCGLACGCDSGARSTCGACTQAAILLRRPRPRRGVRRLRNAQTPLSTDYFRWLRVPTASFSSVSRRQTAGSPTLFATGTTLSNARTGWTQGYRNRFGDLRWRTFGLPGR